MEARPAAPVINNNHLDAMERRLHIQAAVYALLGFFFLLRAAVPSIADSYLAAGLALCVAAVALSVISFHLRRFPVAATAAARIAQVALRLSSDPVHPSKHLIFIPTIGQLRKIDEAIYSCMPVY
ncbi:hypothetical protein BRADI_4g13779v3 [Brachypodium distachyon]|uniref:Uncharacterized protein n=1 Tax=Brachypodium distachyon TaxID=15368 RepID=A0A2K2CMM6_BRADI|nr:hypothetical protein BRADI_4g13779v3 [Brachypodium distachyon]